MPWIPTSGFCATAPRLQARRSAWRNQSEAEPCITQAGEHNLPPSTTPAAPATHLLVLQAADLLSVHDHRAAVIARVPVIIKG